MTHTRRDGPSRASFARSAPERWQQLVDALCAQGTQGDSVDTITLPGSVQYVIEGELAAPDGRTPRIRTVWETQATNPRPRLVTAYPAR